MEMPSRFGPRHCGQSAANKLEETKANKMSGLIMDMLSVFMRREGSWFGVFIIGCPGLCEMWNARVYKTMM